MANKAPVFSLVGSKTAQKAPRRFLLRLAHPQEAAILALLALIANGEQDVAGKAAEIERLLTEDGMFASFSTNSVVNGVPSDVPFTDPQTGLPSLQSDQFLLYGRAPGTAEGDEAQVLMRSWAGRQGRPGFVKGVMEFANTVYRASLAPAAPATSQIPAGHAPVAAGGSEVRLQ